MLQAVVSPSKMALSNAVASLTVRLFGDGLSPYLIGLLSDHFHDKYAGSQSTSITDATETMRRTLM